jgi:hypothetical protein
LIHSAVGLGVPLAGDSTQLVNFLIARDSGGMPVKRGLAYLSEKEGINWALYRLHKL